jgi:hypothetical protein
MFSPILLIHGQKLMLLLLIAERVLVTDSAFTVSPRQVGRSSRRPHLDLAKLALDRLLEELSPAGGGHLARPPLRSARRGHRMWCRNSCSLRLLPLLPVQDQAAATSSPSHTRSSLLPAPHRPPSFVTRPSTPWLSCPCLASTLLLVVAPDRPDQQLRLSPRVWPIAPTRRRHTT